MSTTPSNGMEGRPGQNALAMMDEVWDVEVSEGKIQTSEFAISSPSKQRRLQSLRETPFDTTHILEEVGFDDSASAKSTVLYLAYGSNLSAETFKGRRQIKPISQVNVLVPELELTFDLPGIPYNEPCFANTRYRSAPGPSISRTNDYHKDRWHKGLVGVVYEVTKADYAKIIASEGGGAGYQDIVVDCYEIAQGTKVVDPNPVTTPFKAHTLFAPALPPSEPGSPPPANGGRISRPDPSYAQPSARYLKLITNGADEHSLPDDYKDFLYALRLYTITSVRQKLGKVVFTATWMPIILGLFGLSKLVSDDKGRVPKWMVTVTNIVFTSVWFSYDHGFKQVF